MTDAASEAGVQSPSTAPKPFVFVLMPFASEFNDVYKYGIKGAVEDVGAYAERVDEQLFKEGILDRIFNQISKADVIVADMTDKNPNVFYEVGYAHALDKTVLLLTKRAEDIPFDLKHRPHIVYEGSIDQLRQQLSPRLEWALEASRSGGTTRDDRLAVFVCGERVRAVYAREPCESPSIAGLIGRRRLLEVCIRNDGSLPSQPITHIYLFCPRSDWRPLRADSSVVLRPLSVDPDTQEESELLRYQLEYEIDSIPPAAVERFYVKFSPTEPPGELPMKLRFHWMDRYSDYPFRLLLQGTK